MNKLVKAVRAVFVFDVAVILVQIATRSFLGKNLSMSEFGLFTLMITITTFVTALISPDIAITRYVAVYAGRGQEGEVRAWIKFTVFFSFIIGLAGCVVLFLLSDFLAEKVFHQPSMVFLMKIAALSIIIGVPWYLSSAALRGLYKFGEASFTAFSQNAIFLLFVLGGVFLFQWGGAEVFVLFLVSYIASLALNFFFLRRHLPLKDREASYRSEWQGFQAKAKETLRYYAPLLIKSVGSISTARFGHFVVASFLPLAQLGAYGAIYPLATISGFLVRSTSEPLTADFSEKEGKADEEAKKNLYIKSSRFFLFFSFLIAFGAFVFSEELIVLFFKKSYLIALHAFILLLLAEAFNSVTTPSTRLLYAEGETLIIGFVSLGSGVVTVISSLLLVKPLGITGVALAALASFALYALAYFIIIYWKKKWWFGWDAIVVTVGSAALLFYLANFFQLFELSIVFKFGFALTGSAMYVLLGLGAGVITTGDLKKILFQLTRP